MFSSEPVCILQAGPTVDGRNIAQQVIDDVVEMYDQALYNAVINEEHWDWSYKFGCVQSLEKRGNQLFAVLKPNSLLLQTLERGQLLHTSCELDPDFAETGKWYLTGLALTDKPASLGTTPLHLSNEQKKKVYLSTGSTVTKANLETAKQHHDELSLLSRLKALLSSSDKKDNTLEELEMSDELKEMLKLNTEQGKAVNDSLIKLTEKLSNQAPQSELGHFVKDVPLTLASLTTLLSKEPGKIDMDAPLTLASLSVLLSKEPTKSNEVDVLQKLRGAIFGEEDEPESEGEEGKFVQLSSLKEQVEKLSSDLKVATEALSRMTDEDERSPAGQSDEEKGVVL
ncbi:GPO family capsid scaffolding protein [Vibrio sp. OPT18]|uniref:GPO family capsid scaffolding protein n=1 Tax=Vibrio sp. OPT18 TaxID=2778641 RepID=UPI00187E1156|nr:GPO family capsid scaffolding protein [Vibrio sp. OPT18]MBE8574454.1 GPO family capsid scaffolding protein [Vibrio sp. OPT18]